MQILKYIAVFVLLIAHSANGQISFYKNYADNGYDYGEGIVQLEDSSYIICGSSSSFTNGPSQAFLMKVDSAGVYQWSNHYGGIESESARRVLYKKNFGFFMAGYTNSFGNGSYDFYLAKIDENGQIEWDKTYGGSGWDRIYDAALTKDTGTILVGEKYSSISGKDWYIVRTDINGDTLWTKSIGGAGDEFARTIEQYNDSMYVIGGHLFAMDSLKTRGYLVYIHENGTIYDRDTLGVSGAYDIYDMTFANDTLQAVGSYQFSSTSYEKMAFYQMKMMPDSISLYGFYEDIKEGEYIGRQISTYGSPAHRYVAFTFDHNEFSYPFGMDVEIARYDNVLGWLNQVTRVAADYMDISNQLIPTSDGGAALIGSREGIGIGGATIFLLKIGQNETIPLVDGVTFINQLVEINEEENSNDFKVYPNPAEYSFNVEVAEGVLHKVVLRDVTGKQLLEADVLNKKQIDVQTISAGIYNLEIWKDGQLIITKRIIIQ